MTTTTTVANTKIFDASHLQCFKHIMAPPELKSGWVPFSIDPFIPNTIHLERLLQTRPLTPGNLAALLNCSTTKSGNLLRYGFSTYVDIVDLQLLEFCFTQGLAFVDPEAVRKEIQQRLLDLHAARLRYRERTLLPWYRGKLKDADLEELSEAEKFYEKCRYPYLQHTLDTDGWERLASLSRSRCGYVQGCN